MDLKWEVAKHLRLDQVRDYFSRLTDREQYIVLGVSAGVLALIFVIAVTTSVGTIHSLKKSIRNDEKLISEIAKYRSDYDETKDEVERMENVINQTDATFSLTSHLENIAQQYDVKPGSMNPKAVPPNDLYVETQVGVSIDKVTLPALTDYLYRIENSRGVIRINSISIKPNYADPSVLNVDFSVSAFTGKK